MSMRRTPAPHAGHSGGGGGSTFGVHMEGGGRVGAAATEAVRRDLRQLASVQADVRAVTARLEHVEESVSKGIGAGSDAARATKRVQQELKSTARHFLSEQVKDKEQIRKTEQRLRSAETRLAELGLSDAAGGTLTLEGKSQGALVDVLKPLVHSMVAETMGRQGDLFAEVIDQLTAEVRRIEQMFDERVEQNQEELRQLRRQVDSVQQHSTSTKAQAESALSAVEDLRVDTLDVLQAVQTTVAAQSASAEEHFRSMPEQASPAPSQAEFDDMRSQVQRLDAKIESVVENVDAKIEQARQQTSTAGHSSELEKEMVSMLQRQIESLQGDLKTGEQRLAEVDVKCVAALDATARNRKVAKKLEAKVDSSQERLDTRLDRLAAQAMQRPPAPEEMAESVPPPAPRTFSAVPADSAGSIGLATPSMLRGSAGVSTSVPTGAHGARGSMWEEHTAVDGQLYYYNAQTRQTTWTRPPEMSNPLTTFRPSPEAAADRVLGGTAERVATLEQVVAEERNQRMLMKEDLHMQLKKLKRRSRKLEARVEESLVAASDRRSRKAATRRVGEKHAKGSADDEVETDDDDSEFSISPKSLLLETAQTKSKLDQLEIALQRVELTTMRLDEKRNVAGAEDGSDEDVESTRAGPELKQLSARLSKVEKSVRSQATATMREMHDHETQLRGFRTQLSGLADAGGIRLVGIDEDGRAPSIDGRLDALEGQLAHLGVQEKKMRDALQVLQENETLVKMTCAQLADEVAGIQGDRRTPLGVLLDDDDVGITPERAGMSTSDEEGVSTSRGAKKADRRGAGGGDSDARLLRQTTLSVQRLDTRVTALEGEVVQLSRSRTVAGGGNSSALGSRLERLPHWDGDVDATRSRAPASVMETRARDFLMQSMDRYGVGSTGGATDDGTRLSSRTDAAATFASSGRAHLESFRSKREE